ncbi:MAG: haloacid dehalogenase [Phycisphaeraceae bacterium]|nr:MAG: haloacid dehalogenase [Phycisphaeraceae bacterium]
MGEAPVRLVCFDWGGVILRICRGFSEGLTAAGLDVRPGADDADMYHVRREASMRYQIGDIDEEAFFAEIVSTLNGAYTTEEIALVHDAWLIGEYEGVAELVAELHDGGRVRTGMLSNTNARHWARRERDFPTAGTLHHQHASHLLRSAKPNAETYRAFERESGVPAAEILFFDDLPENIDAARAAGWRGVVIDHTGDTAAQMRAALTAAGVLDG